MRRTCFIVVTPGSVVQLSSVKLQAPGPPEGQEMVDVIAFPHLFLGFFVFLLFFFCHSFTFHFMFSFLKFK